MKERTDGLMPAIHLGPHHQETMSLIYSLFKDAAPSKFGQPIKTSEHPITINKGLR